MPATHVTVDRQMRRLARPGGAAGDQGGGGPAMSCTLDPACCDGDGGESTYVGAQLRVQYRMERLPRGGAAGPRWCVDDPDNCANPGTPPSGAALQVQRALRRLSPTEAAAAVIGFDDPDECECAAEEPVTITCADCPDLSAPYEMTIPRTLYATITAATGSCASLVGETVEIRYANPDVCSAFAGTASWLGYWNSPRFGQLLLSFNPCLGPPFPPAYNAALGFYEMNPLFPGQCKTIPIVPAWIHTLQLCPDSLSPFLYTLPDKLGGGSAPFCPSEPGPPYTDSISIIWEISE